LAFAPMWRRSGLAFAPMWRRSGLAFAPMWRRSGLAFAPMWRRFGRAFAPMRPVRYGGMVARRSDCGRARGLVVARRCGRFTVAGGWGPARG
ncbi:hypothetical protein ACFVWG_18020, partial [Kribbella sp. NPDC058245]|uniref:hypothetical protein n=1 Tax=Kribbella sp. NPDC058245 TaxID=3346399 RepID=UPI0036E5B5EC